MRKEILGWIETIAVAVLLAFLINHFLLVNVYAVSYTHLDVYKRQAFFCAKS